MYGKKRGAYRNSEWRGICVCVCNKKTTCVWVHVCCLVRSGAATASTVEYSTEHSGAECSLLLSSEKDIRSMLIRWPLRPASPGLERGAAGARDDGREKRREEKRGCTDSPSPILVTAGGGWWWLAVTCSREEDEDEEERRRRRKSRANRSGSKAPAKSFLRPSACISQPLTHSHCYVLSPRLALREIRLMRQRVRSGSLKRMPIFSSSSLALLSHSFLCLWLRELSLRRRRRVLTSLSLLTAPLNLIIRF